MLSNIAIELENIWKKYSRQAIFHRSLREDIATLFSTKTNQNELEKDEFWALKNINLKVRKGETVGLYGPNGSGKSTILKLIAGVTYPTKGEIKVQGRIAPLLEVGAGFHPDLSGRENVFINGAILGMHICEIKQKIDDIIAFSGVKDFIDMPVKKYSSGMYVRLAFSVAVYSEAEIYLFDEALAAGDESFQISCEEKIRELQKKRKTILLATHIKDSLLRNTDRIFSL